MWGQSASHKRGYILCYRIVKVDEDGKREQHTYDAHEVETVACGAEENAT